MAKDSFSKWSSTLSERLSLGKRILVTALFLVLTASMVAMLVSDVLDFMKLQELERSYVVHCEQSYFIWLDFAIVLGVLIVGGLFVWAVDSSKAIIIYGVVALLTIPFVIYLHIKTQLLTANFIYSATVAGPAIELLEKKYGKETVELALNLTRLEDLEDCIAGKVTLMRLKVYMLEPRCFIKTVEAKVRQLRGILQEYGYVKACAESATSIKDYVRCVREARSLVEAEVRGSSLKQSILQ